MVHSGVTLGARARARGRARALEVREWGSEPEPYIVTLGARAPDLHPARSPKTSAFRRAFPPCSRRHGVLGSTVSPGARRLRDPPCLRRGESGSVHPPESGSAHWPTWADSGARAPVRGWCIQVTLGARPGFPFIPGARMVPSGVTLGARPGFPFFPGARMVHSGVTLGARARAAVYLGAHWRCI